jgi:hypothetical protein
MQADVPAVAATAARAELGWRDDEGALHATAVVPLVIDGAVSVALPFADTPLARRLARATSAVLVCSDPRMARRGWTPLAVPVRVTVTPDRTGKWTWSGALDQEVRKYPPSQLLIDTAIQRREHWWYVPRLIVRLDPVGPTTSMARRGGPDDGVLITADGDGLGAWSVAVDDWDDDRVAMTALDARHPFADHPGQAALLFTHDFAIPDQERAVAFAVRGRLEGRRLHVTAREGARQLAPSRLVPRLRDHIRFSRACRQALAAYDAGVSADAT